MRDKIRSLVFHKSIVKFAIVGYANVLIGAAIMFGLYNLAGCGYWLSSASSYLLASVFSYFANKRWTFENKERSNRAIALFALNIAICYFIAYSLAKPIIYYLLSGFEQSARDNIAMFVGMCIFTALNYIGQRFFVFRTQRKENGQDSLQV
ncbi:MAG: GtrA family protein [Helicobacteraceae bacterium]|jgi:putative flippase GtrA|nr:GtrA family protein [Helicobacteraceae bacterium]